MNWYFKTYRARGPKAVESPPVESIVDGPPPAGVTQADGLAASNGGSRDLWKVPRYPEVQWICESLFVGELMNLVSKNGW